MKALSLLKSAIFVGLLSLIWGCQKQLVAPVDTATANLAVKQTALKINKTQEHKLKGEYTGSYNFEPDPANGWMAPNPAPAWYAGTAQGQLNLLGKSESLLNMYATFGPNGLQGAAAPLNLFFKDQLEKSGITVPDAVAVIFFDKQGNSIWARGNGIIDVTLVSPTRATFTAPLDIIGGTGKFANATGQLHGSGYFNPQDTNEAGVTVQDGTIIY